MKQAHEELYEIAQAAETALKRMNQLLVAVLSGKRMVDPKRLDARLNRYFKAIHDLEMENISEEEAAMRLAMPVIDPNNPTELITTEDDNAKLTMYWFEASESIIMDEMEIKKEEDENAGDAKRQGG